MKIPNDVFLKWRSLYDRGDAQRIAEVAGVHKNTIFNAFNRRAASPHLIHEMTKFFKEKAKIYGNLS